MKKTLILILVSIISFTAAAQVGYVNDQIQIWTHTGPSNNYKVKYKLTPGEKFQILQTNEETGFIQIKDESGRVSWMDSKFLTRQPTAGRLLKDAKSEIEKIKSSNQSQVEQLEKKVRELSPLRGANNNLQDELAKLQTEYEQIKQEGQMHKNRFISEFFFAGAVVFVAGMLFGWVLSKLGGRNRSSSWS